MDSIDPIENDKETRLETIKLIDFYRVSEPFSIGSIESNRAQSIISRTDLNIYFTCCEATERSIWNLQSLSKFSVGNKV